MNRSRPDLKEISTRLGIPEETVWLAYISVQGTFASSGGKSRYAKMNESEKKAMIANMVASRTKKTKSS